MAAKKAKQSQTPVGDEVFIQRILEQRRDIAAELRQSTSRTQASQALAEIFQATPDTQFGLVKALAKQQEVDAADVLLAMHELAPQKEVRKEARRALIQLAGSKIYPSWAPGSEQPTAISSNYPPRFWKGVVTLSRESAQVRVSLSWEYGFEYSEARLMSFLLDFWQDGVNDFYMKVGSRRHIDELFHEQTSMLENAQENSVQSVDCTLAEAKRLLLEALDVNTWRKTAPHKDYRHYLPTIQQLILNAPETGTDRGLTFINPGLEPDEVVGHFLGGWAFGDFGLCYDLLGGDSPVREGLERDEWIARRRAWSDEAHPQRYEPRVIREREQAQSAIWLPGSFLSDRSTTRREIDACWSLELADTPLSGTLPEMPLGTAVLRETGRHWFWTGYTLVSEEEVWRIQRFSDEGANAQGLPLASLEQRFKEQSDAIQDILDNKDPRGPDGQKILEELLWRTNYALYYLDALLVKNPLDPNLYQDAAGYAISIGLRERAVVYLQKWVEHFPHDAQNTRILQQLGAIEATLAADYAATGLERRARRFLELAEQSALDALNIRSEAMSYMLLGEMKITQGQLDAALNYLQQALAANPSREEEAQIENDLAGINMERDQPAEALRHYQRVEELTPGIKSLWFNMGLVNRVLKNTNEAEKYLKRSIEEEPEYSEAFIELAALYASTRDYGRAIQVTEQGLQLHPNSAHLRALLASIYLEQGDGRRAEAELKEAERIDADHQFVKMVRRRLNEAQRRVTRER